MMILGRAKCETFKGVLKNVLGWRTIVKPKGEIGKNVW